jgi:hypothetical protein
VVRSPRLKLALLASGVLVAHFVVLEWVARETSALTGLKPMAPPMYTRLLKPAAPPPVVAQPAPAAAPAKPKPKSSAFAVAAPPRRPASSPQELARERQRTLERALAQVRKLDEERQLAQQREAEQRRAEQAAQAAQAAASAASAPATMASAPASAAPAPVAVASAAAQPASAATAAASAPQPAASAALAQALNQWPVDTRLSYNVTGMYRGPLYGNARVFWQRQGDQYEVRLEVNVSFITQILTSQGQVTAAGLLPRDYEELRSPGNKRRITRLGDETVTLDNGTKLPRPPGVQDTASQFVELAQRFALGKEKLVVGRTVSVWLARPGSADEWTYDIAGREMLHTPMGDVEAYHLKPRAIPIPRGNISAEMWFAPSLQYLPVKIRVTMGDEAYLDLMVEQIDQK